MATWVGFVLAISFMEAWLKFTAPGITLPLGLGIGRIVFAALNRVELVCAIVTFVLLFKKLPAFTTLHLLLLATPVAILLAETFYLLPALDTRAGVYLAGKVPPASHLHIIYVVCDFVKVVALTGNIIVALRLFKPRITAA